MSFQNSVDKLTTSIAAGSVAKAVKDNQIINQFQEAQNELINAAENVYKKEEQLNEKGKAIEEEEKRLPTSTIESNLNSNLEMRKDLEGEYSSLDSDLEEPENYSSEEIKNKQERMFQLDSTIRGYKEAERNMRETLYARKFAQQDYEDFKANVLGGAEARADTAQEMFNKAKNRYYKRFGGKR